MPATVLRIVQEIDAISPIYHVSEAMPDPHIRERKTRHRLQLILALDSPETPRFIRPGS
jgi:uncharacterized membrane protein